MASTVGLSKPQQIWTRWTEYDSKRQTWATEAANLEDFFYGKQWTNEEIKTLTDRGMAPLVVNRAMPIIQQEVAIFIAKRPTFRYFPAEDDDTGTAAVFSDCAQHVWHISDGDTHYQAAVQDAFVMGAGYLLAYIDPYADEGRGEVMFKSVPVWDVYIDPNSRELDLSDARFILISRRIDKEQLVFLYPDKAAKVRRAENEEGPVTDRVESNPNTIQNYSQSQVDYAPSDSDGKVRIIEQYEKVREQFWKIMDRNTGKIQIVKELPDSPAFHDQGSAIRAIPIYKTRVHVTVCLGNSLILDKYVLGTPIYPLVNIFLHHRRNPFPSGDMAVIKGMCQEVNKRRSIMIHNATLAGNYRIMAEKGSIHNKEEFEKKGSQPGYILEYLNTGGPPPREMLPQALPTAWIQLEQEAKGDIEYALSVFPHMMGSNDGAPDTYRGLLALEEKGQQKIQYKARNARGALRRLGLVVMHLIQETYSPNKMIRIVGEENEEVKQVFVNTQKMDPLTGQLATLNDLTIGSYDLVVVDGTAMPTNRMALLNLYLEMYQLGIIDKTEVLKKTDIRDKEGVMQRMGEVQQLQGQLEQAVQELKDKDGLNQTMRRQLMQSEVHVGASDQLLKGERQLLQTSAVEEVTRKKMQVELEAMKGRIKLAEQQAKNAATNIVERTGQDMALRKLQQELEADIERKQRKSKSVD